MLTGKDFLSWREHTSSEAVFRHYLTEGAPLKLGVRFICPHRVDGTASCALWKGKSEILLKDFATGDTLDAQTFVARKFNIDLRKANRRIVSEVEKTSGEQVETSKKILDFEFRAEPLLNSKWYWDGFKIPINIVSRFAFAASIITIGGDKVVCRSTKKNPIYIYKFLSGNFKWYRPLSPDKSLKWGGNAVTTDIGGYYQLPKNGNLLIITSSIKDVMVLTQHGFNAICFNGENVGGGETSYKELLPYMRGLKRRFKRFVIFLDSDPPGINASIKLSERLKSPYFTLNGPCKDISDYQKKYGVRRTALKTRRLISKCLKS